ncbi:MAG: hypothetical protein N3B13_05445, partial [Deltaproteobacteria bacterium]|nr:hypothetical protein [Deltaproteobacteria bacterium]
MKNSVVFLLMILVLCSCSDGSTGSGDIISTDSIYDISGDAGYDVQGDTGDKDSGYIPPRTYYKVDKHSVVVKDTPFSEERVKFYYKAEQLADTDVLKFVNADNLYALTKSGLYVYNENLDIFEKSVPEIDGITDIGEIRKCDYLIGRTKDKIILFNSKETKEIDIGTIGEEIVSLYGVSNHYYFATKDSIYEVNLDFSGYNKVTEFPNIKSIAVDENQNIYAATDKGVYVSEGLSLKIYNSENDNLGDNLVSSLAFCDDGALIIATFSGYTIYKDNKFDKFFAKPDGLPMNKSNSADCGNGIIALGHEIGATFISLKDGHIDYYLSRRWIMDDKVNDVAIDKNGNRFIATSKGISRIYLVETNLKDKIRYFEELQDNYFWRMDGFVAPDLSSSDEFEIKDPKVWDSDNDGLWTQMQVAAWCMAYAV